MATQAGHDQAKALVLLMPNPIYICLQHSWDRVLARQQPAARTCRGVDDRRGALGGGRTKEGAHRPQRALPQKAQQDGHAHRGLTAMR